MMPENEAKYVANWREVLSDYEFKLWNEQNFDINSTKFTKQVASVRKWGFVVDYIRAYAIFNYGGIYLDTDVEVIRSFDDLLDNTCFVGFEDEHNVNPGSAFAGEKSCTVALDMINFYKDYDFINKDGSLNLTPSPQILSKILLKYGFTQSNVYQSLSNITIYPSEYFTPKSFITGITTVTEKTHSIHHFVGSWVSEDAHKSIQRRWDFYEKYSENKFVIEVYNKIRNYKIKRTIKKLLGEKLGEKIRKYRGRANGT
jgi:mannosyltransferase OCH1-like enzyme